MGKFKYSEPVNFCSRQGGSRGYNIGMLVQVVNRTCSLRQELLFDLGVEEAMSEVKDEGTAAPRLKKPERNQVEFRACAWNDLLSDDHQARIVWQYVLGLDLSELYRQIKAVEGHVGQPAIDPRILFALWLYANLRGIGRRGSLTVVATQRRARCRFSGFAAAFR